MDKANDSGLLAKAELFNGIDGAAVAEISRMASHKRASKGEVVFEQGDPAGACHVLVEGRVKVTQLTPDGQQVVIRFIGPGEMFGCIAVFVGGDYPGTATAVTDSQMLAWDGRKMGMLMERYPGIAVNALAIVGKRLLALQSRYRELATERVERRIARAILRLARQAGKRVEEGVLIDFPLSRQDVAEMTGATLHTVSRILSAWEQQGLIASGRQRITIRRPHGLVSIAEDL